MCFLSLAIDVREIANTAASTNVRQGWGSATISAAMTTTNAISKAVQPGGLMTWFALVGQTL